MLLEFGLINFSFDQELLGSRVSDLWTDINAKAKFEISLNSQMMLGTLERLE